MYVYIYPRPLPGVGFRGRNSNPVVELSIVVPSFRSVNELWAWRQCQGPILGGAQGLCCGDPIHDRGHRDDILRHLVHIINHGGYDEKEHFEVF
jgi:hypothetical protein